MAVRLGRAEPSLLHGGEEGPVEEEQLVQAGEDPLHRLYVQLHLLLHAPAENLGHDVQRLQVVELRLHQLCSTRERSSALLGAISENYKCIGDTFFLSCNSDTRSP